MSEYMGKKGTRCAVCVGCGRCFEMAEDAAGAARSVWKGQRCDVCVSCGKCAEAWGLTGDVDAVSHATDMASAAARLDFGHHGSAAPLMPAPPGSTASRTASVTASPKECDAVSGATPGMSEGCKAFGLDNMEEVVAQLGIKPPGMS